MASIWTAGARLTFNLDSLTQDLRDLRAALAARAADDGVTESDVLRSALAAALGNGGCVPTIPSASAGQGPSVAMHVKLSVRLTRLAAHRLDQSVRAAGLSRGAYLTCLIDGAPPVMASADRLAGIAALSASSAELAVLGRDVNQLTKLLRMGSVEAARQYRERLETLDADVRAHLDLAAGTLAELSSMRTSAVRRAQTFATDRRSPP